MTKRSALPLLLGAFFISGVSSHVDVVRAQVSTNLDALPPSSAPSHTTPHNPSIRRTSPGAASHAPMGGNKSGAVFNATSSRVPARKRAGVPPDVPEHPPGNVVIVPPGISVSQHPPVPPEAIHAVPTAKGEVYTLKDRIRVTFTAGSAAVNQAMIDRIAAEGHRLAQNTHVRVTLWSSASGSSEDLSAPRRLSLARALVVRSILIRQGVATTRIYPRATGLAPPTQHPQDRVDIVAFGSVPVAASQAQFGVTSPKVPK